MIAKSTKDFQNNVLKKMTFTPYPKDNYILYTNKKRKDLGYFINIAEMDIMILALVIILFQLIFLFTLNIVKSL